MKTDRTAPFAVILATSFAMSCAARTVPVNAPSKTPAQAWDMRTVVQVVNLPMGLGTGFIVDKRGLVITNSHVVEPSMDPQTMRVIAVGDMRVCVGRAPVKSCMKAKVLAQDKEHDLALLLTEKPLPAEVTLGDESTLTPDDEVTLVGNVLQILEPSPLSGRFVGMATKAYTEQTVFNITLPVLILDLALPRGASGGPVFDAQGRVVAVGRGFSDEDITTRSFAIAVPVSFVKELVRKHSPFTKADGKKK